MTRRHSRDTGRHLTVVTTVNEYANETSAVCRKLGLGSNVVGLQYGWEGLTISHLRA